jgi:hypothetical protein
MSENQPNEPKKRDGGLRTWLVLILLGNAIFLISLLASVWKDFFFVIFPFGVILGFFEFFSESFLIPLWSIPFFVIYSAISICSVILLFAWRKWGFYAICIITIAGLVTGIVSGFLTLGILAGCASIVILGILLRSEWKLFR